MPTHRVKYQGKIRDVEHTSSKPTPQELLAVLQNEAPPIERFDYPKQRLVEPPDPQQYYPKTGMRKFVEAFEPTAFKEERPDRSMFHFDSDKMADIGSRLPEPIRRPVTGIASGIGEMANTFASDPESAAMFGISRVPKPSVNKVKGISEVAFPEQILPAEFTPRGGEAAHNVFREKPVLNDPAVPKSMRERLGELELRTRDAISTGDEIGAVGDIKAIKAARHSKRGNLTGRFIKKDQPIEPDMFDRGEFDIPEEPIDYVQQMLDSLKLADTEKKLKGLTPEQQKNIVREAIETESKKNAEIGTVYHGSRTAHEGPIESAGKGSGWAMFRKWNHYTEDPELAGKYATGEGRELKGLSPEKYRPNVTPAKISAKNPLDATQKLSSDHLQKVKDFLVKQKSWQEKDVLPNDPAFIQDRLKYADLEDFPFDAIRYEEYGKKNWAVPGTTDVHTPSGVKLHRGKK